MLAFEGVLITSGGYEPDDDGKIYTSFRFLKHRPVETVHETSEIKANALRPKGCILTSEANIMLNL